MLCCFDRIVITGTLPEIVHAEAMARYLGVVCVDYPRWAEPLREELRTHAERLAAEACVESSSSVLDALPVAKEKLLVQAA